MMRLSLNHGFVTNSSSCIYFFDKRVLEDKRVKDILSTYGIENGLLPDDVWNRSMCDSILITKEQKEIVNNSLTKSDYSEYCRVSLDGGPEDSVVVIYGDEYDNFGILLSNVMEEVSQELKLPIRCMSFN